MPGWAGVRDGIVGLRLRLLVVGVVTAILIGVSVRAKDITLAQGLTMSSPKERWVFTATAHFTWYGLLALAPIYRDPVESVLLDQERVYLAVTLPDSRAQFLALDRHNGHPVWERRLPFEGYPIRGQLIPVAGHLAAALFDGKTEEVIVVRIDPTDGEVIWRVNLPGAKGPTLGGHEVVLDSDPKGENVIVYFPRSKQRNRVMLRATDGQLVAETSYNGYLWRLGTHQAAGMIFGYDGMDPREYDRLLAFQENNGDLVWTLPLPRRWVSPPTVADDSLLIASKDKLLRINLSTGKPLWTVNLHGRGPVLSDPPVPVVIPPRMAVLHRATPDLEDKHWILSIRRLADGVQEAEVPLGLLSYAPDSLSRMADLVIVGSDLMLKIIDVRSAQIVAAVDFEESFSWFVYVNFHAIWIADRDLEGFVVVTTDGRLRYFSAADFRDRGGPSPR